MKVKNNGSNPLVIGTAQIMPGDSADVSEDDLKRVRKNKAFKAMQDAGTIKIGSTATKEEPKAGDNNQQGGQQNQQSGS